MKTITMKGKNVEEATKTALEVLGVRQEQVNIKVINEGKQAIMGIIGGEEAEIEVTVKEGLISDSKQVLQNILDKMGFLAIAEGEETSDPGGVKINVKGEDMGRIIGKEGAMLKALETVVSTIISKMNGSRVRVSIDAGGYRSKREKALERLANDVASEVETSGKEKTMPYLEASDRRIIHTYLQNNPNISTYSKGEGKERRMVIAPKQ